MTRMRGWGLLLAIAFPVLIFFSWQRLGAEKTRVEMERYEAWTAEQSAQLLRPLNDYFAKHLVPAAAGDLSLPPVPAKSGVKSWVLQADGTLLITLDFKFQGKPLRLRWVPVVRPARYASGSHSVVYDCVRSGPGEPVPRLCQGETLKTEGDVEAQLAANAQALENLPPVVSASGVALAAGADMGSVVVVPATASDLNHCGFQCVKPQSCVTPRPLACGKLTDEGGGRFFAIAATAEDHRASDFASRSAADAACAQNLGTGYRMVPASSIGGVFRLTGDREYWVHNDVRPAVNCWGGD
ncbi:MAG: hypothetical protein U5M53_09475 [Rhodoferax sp.]|nr:hypothetical protein [Rhodoferax sp.]